MLCMKHYRDEWTVVRTLLSQTPAIQFAASAEISGWMWRGLFATSLHKIDSLLFRDVLRDPEKGGASTFFPPSHFTRNSIKLLYLTTCPSIMVRFQIYKVSTRRFAVEMLSNEDCEESQRGFCWKVSVYFQCIVTVLPPQGHLLLL